MEPREHISDQELQLIMESWQRTTPGPWKSWVEGRDHWGGDDFISTQTEDIYLSGNRTADQDFIADAHQDIPLLVAEIRRLRSLLKK